MFASLQTIETRSASRSSPVVWFPRVVSPAQTQPARRADSHMLETLEPGASTLCVEKDREIYSQGDPAEFCYRILSGTVRTVKLMEDGRRQVAEFLLPGDFLGLDALDEHDLAAEAVTATVLRRYARRTVEALADHDPTVARRLRGLAGTKLRVAREQMMLLGRKTAVERIASFLSDMTARMPHGPDGRIALAMGRADIADHLGLTIETVCRTLACLRRDGVIEMAREAVAIRDARSLHALACDPRH